MGKYQRRRNTKELLVVLYWKALKEAGSGISFENPESGKTKKLTKISGDFLGSHEHKEENYERKVDFRAQ